jgi:hypothetical protein
MRLRDLPKDVDNTLLGLVLLGGYGNRGDTLASDVAAEIAELGYTVKQDAVESRLKFLNDIGELKINGMSWWQPLRYEIGSTLVGH